MEKERKWFVGTDREWWVKYSANLDNLLADGHFGCAFFFRKDKGIHKISHKSPQLKNTKHI